MYPNTFYRVSVKAFITNDDNQVLVVKENQEFWSLPGGGLDHGELQPDCLKRELNEELGIKDIKIGKIAYSKSFYLDKKDAWLLWIVYKVKLSDTELIFGDGVTDVKFIDTHDLENSKDMFEKSVFEVAKIIQ